MTQRGIAIGIDLGTTHSCVAIWKNDNPKVIENGQGHMTTRSYVSFSDISDIDDTLVGDEAYNKAGRNLANTVYDAKRLIGRRFSDQFVQTDMKLWPFKVIKDADDKPMIVVQHKGQRKEFSPEEISSMVLGKMRKIAETYHGSPVKNAVITVPAGFNDAQRQATKKAGEMAGLTVLRIINEPTAAAIAYGLDLKAGGNLERNVMIFDWGGGTLDVSLLIMGNGAFDVKATSGDTHLGGEDLDNSIVNYCIKEFNKQHNNSFVPDAKALRKAKAKCEEAKKVLSFSLTTDIEIDSWCHSTDFSTTFTRDTFEELNMDIFKKCMEPVKRCLKDAGMNITDVHDIVIVGGSSRIPKVQELLQEVFKGKELCKSINPDEAIACGAAVQAAISMRIVSEKLKHFSLLDIIPTSLGVDVRNGATGAENFMQVVIPRNTRVPVVMKKTLTTHYDNQKDVKFAIYEGESTSTLKNNYLGEFTLQDIPPARKRVPQFDVSFEVNEDGILSVSAEDMSTRQKKGIKIDYHRPKNNAGPSDRSASPARKSRFGSCFCGS